MTGRAGGRTTVAPDGRTIAFDVHGVSGGPPVFYLHGVPSSRLETHVFAVPEAARMAGVSLVAIDRPGIGGSDPRPDRTLTDTAADLAAVADSLGHDRFALVGYSAGCPSALAATVVLRDRVTALALVGGIAPGDRPELFEGQADEVARTFAWARDHPRRLHAMLRVMRLGTRRPDMLVKAAIKGAPPADVAVLSRPGAAADFAAFLAAAFRQGIAGVAADLRLAAGSWDFDLAEVTVPTHLWHGALDRNAPVACARWLAGQLADSRLEVTPDGGHASVLAVHGAEILGRLVGR